MGFKYSEPTEKHNEYVIRFSIKWRISRSTLIDLVNDALKELEIFKYDLKIDLEKEDYFNISIEFNSYSDNEASYLMDKIIEFFPEEIEFENIWFGPIDEERLEYKSKIQPIGYRRIKKPVI